jgi:hypothetical protein
VRAFPGIPMSTIPSRRTRKRKSYILHLWQNERDEADWIGEIQEVPTGETVRLRGLEALMEFRQTKTRPAVEPEEKECKP